MKAASAFSGAVDTYYMVRLIIFKECLLKGYYPDGAEKKGVAVPLLEIIYPINVRGKCLRGIERLEFKGQLQIHFFFSDNDLIDQ